MIKNYATDRLLLKVLGKEAASAVLAFYKDNISHFEPWEPTRSANFYTLSYQKASLAAEYNRMAEGKLLRYWIFLKDNPGEIIGSFSFQNFLGQPYQSCSLGYKFSQRYLHMGYAYESIQKGIEIVFNEFHVHRIEAHIMPENIPSLNLIDRLSFRYEGISRSYAWINGCWTDHLRYSLINPKDIDAATSREEELPPLL